MKHTRRMFGAAIFAAGCIVVDTAAAAQQTMASAPKVAELHEQTTMQRAVTIRLERVSLRAAVDALAAQANVEIQYRASAVDVVRTPVTIHMRNVPLGDALQDILKGTDLEAVSSIPNVVTIRSKLADVQNADGVITGKVIRADTKRPVAGAVIVLNQASTRIVTDETGAFRITVPPGEHTLEVRAVGFGRQSRQVTVPEGGTISVDLQLTAVASVLDEVIVTGTVIPTERKAIATPITVIRAEEIEKRGITRIEELFRGDVPGLLALDRGALGYATFSEGLGVRSDVYSRGSADLNGGANPIKTYIDGVELLDPSYLGTIDPRSIERIEIVTGPQAATIYGSGAMGGVMQIFTKKGSGRQSRELKLHVRYGILQNSYSDGRTPEHHDVLSLDGGTGPEFSYTTTLSYDYTGQWQPKLYNRGWGTTIGITHAQGPYTISGSVSATGQTRGTWNSGEYRIYGIHHILTGPGNAGVNGYNSLLSVVSSRVSTSSSQNISFNAGYRLTPQWNHQLTVGRNQTRTALEPAAPDFADVRTVGADSLFRSNQTSGERITWGYNTSYHSSLLRWVSSSVTLGANGSDGQSLTAFGCQVSATASSIVGCRAGEAPNIGIPLDSRNWGAFGTWQVGLFGQLYTTFGVRMEQNPGYGRQVKFDFTPTRGLSYTLTIRDISLKLMGSYGRATRTPVAAQRDEQLVNNPNYEPSQYLQQFSNPDLRPEYSRGPQGGIELYVGNLGSLSINHYQQTVTDLIQRATVDSIWLVYPPLPGVIDIWNPQYQYINIAKVRQWGWEGTAALNAGPFSLKGSYSWNDSRVLAVGSTTFSQYQPGQSFRDLPTHTGSASLGYARGQTSLMVVTNWIGAGISQKTTARIWTAMYGGPRGPYNEIHWRKAWDLQQMDRRVSGYTRTNLNGQHRLSSNMSLTLNMVNAGNSFQSDDDELNPTLGRQTTLGVMYRFGNR